MTQNPTLQELTELTELPNLTSNKRNSRRDPLTDFEPAYQNPAQVRDIVDGDTVDVRLDLGFETQIVERVRVEGIDTRETHLVDESSAEYKRGVVHTRAVETWVNETRDAVDDDWPFVLESDDYERGAYGRVIGDIWSNHHDEWLSTHLLERFDDVRPYERS